MLGCRIAADDSVSWLLQRSIVGMKKRRMVFGHMRGLTLDEIEAARKQAKILIGKHESGEDIFARKRERIESEKRKIQVGTSSEQFHHYCDLKDRGGLGFLHRALSGVSA
jgi:hypothetical protein